MLAQQSSRPAVRLPPTPASSVPPVPRCIPRRRRMPQQPGNRRTVATDAAATCKPLTNFWSELITEQLHASVPGLASQSSYLISHVLGHLLIPFLEALLVVLLLRRLAAAADAWCEANPDRPMSTEVIGLLPGALKGPAVTTVCLMLAVRLLRNAAYLAANLAHMCDRSVQNKAYGMLIDSLANILSPLDRIVLKAYCVISLLFLATVLANWKSIGFGFMLERERLRQEAAEAAAEGGVASGSKRGRSMDELERMVVPLDAATNWLIYMMAIMGCAQVLGVSVAPLVAVGGAGSIILGLATQQLLTNAVMGLSLFFTRPFVNGDSVLVQGSGYTVSGVVENTTVMRTTLRTDDDVVVTIPNKVVADMVVHNRSADVTRSRLARLNRQSDNIKLRLKLPYAQEGRLRELQEGVKAVLEPPPRSSSSSNSGSSSSSSSPAPSPLATMAEAGSSSSSSGSAAGGGNTNSGSSIPASSPPGSRSGSPQTVRVVAAGAGGSHPVVARSVEVVVSKFTDTGMELLVKARLQADPASPAVQGLLLELSRRVRESGAVMVNL